MRARASPVRDRRWERGRSRTRTQFSRGLRAVTRPGVLRAGQRRSGAGYRGLAERRRPRSRRSLRRHHTGTPTLRRTRSAHHTSWARHPPCTRSGSIRWRFCWSGLICRTSRAHLPEDRFEMEFCSR